jgi:hypothetical protein
LVGVGCSVYVLKAAGFGRRRIVVLVLDVCGMFLDDELKFRIPRTPLKASLPVSNSLNRQRRQIDAPSADRFCSELRAESIANNDKRRELK